MKNEIKSLINCIDFDAEAKYNKINNLYEDKISRMITRISIGAGLVLLFVIFLFGRYHNSLVEAKQMLSTKDSLNQVIIKENNAMKDTIKNFETIIINKK